MAGRTPQVTTYFAKLNAELNAAGIEPRTRSSIEWFRTRLQNIRISSQRILKDEALTVRPLPLLGRMFMYFYDPKGKEDLPFYDRFPLIIMVGKAEGGFYGLNLHYLDPRNRALFFDKLTDYTNNKNYDESTRFVLTYKLLSGVSRLRAFQPCLKRYLTAHVTSRIMEVPSQEWETALFLPTDMFVYRTRRQIWTETKKQIR